MKKKRLVRLQNWRWFAIAGLLCCRFASALSPNLTIKELHHTGWGPLQGAPLGGAVALAQTNDGYLWIAGPSGLFRFDGITFERVELPHDQKLSSLGVCSVFAPRDGGLWVGFTFGGAAFLKEGNWQVFGAGDGFPQGSPWRFAETQDGTLWAATTNDLARFDGVRWTAVGSQMGLPASGDPILFVDSQGTIWAGGETALFSLRRGEHQFRNQSVTVPAPWADGSMAESSSGTVWLNAGFDLVPVAQNPPLATPGASSRGGLVFDHDGTLWVSVDGLHRIAYATSQAIGSAVHIEGIPDAYADGDGLTSRTVFAFLVDREGNVWVATTHGLDRFSEPSLTAPLQSAENLKLVPRIVVGGVAPSDDTGGLWITNGVDAVVRYQHGKMSPPVITQMVQSLFRASDGTVWFGGEKTLWRERQGHLESVVPPGPARSTQALAEDKSGNLWASVVRSGIFRLTDGGWISYGGIAALPRSFALAIARDRHDRLWFSYPDGTVAVLEGDLWLNGRTGITHIAAIELQRSRLDPSYRVRGEMIGASDGVIGSAAMVRPLPTAIEAGDGMLWFTTSGGIYGIDPARRVHNRVAPPVLIRGLSVGGRTIEPIRGLTLPVYTTAIRFDYAGLSLTAAEKVRYRYRMDGVDADWHEVTPLRQALYTTLRPGRYTFRVIAANNDGVWNDSGSSRPHRY